MSRNARSLLIALAMVITVVTKEAREDSVVSMDLIVTQAAQRKLMDEDLTPTGNPEVTWEELPEDPIYGRYRAGDWMATVRIPVAEEATDGPQ